MQDRQQQEAGSGLPEGGKARRVYLQLKEEIARGKYAEGTLLPGEQKLAAMLEVSRVTVRRAMDALGAKRTVWMPDDAIHGYDDTYVQNPDKHPMVDLSTIICEFGLQNSRIGLELDNYYFSAAAFFNWYRYN